MVFLVALVFIGVGAFALVFAGRAVSCARFNRALRAQQVEVEGASPPVAHTEGALHVA
jgi:hypothetical protein